MGIPEKKWRDQKGDYANAKRYDIGPKSMLVGKRGRVRRAHILSPTRMEQWLSKRRERSNGDIVRRGEKPLDCLGGAALLALLRWGDAARQ